MHAKICINVRIYTDTYSELTNTPLISHSDNQAQFKFLYHIYSR
jgi:hypothetical protein